MSAEQARGQRQLLIDGELVTALRFTADIYRKAAGESCELASGHGTIQDLGINAQVIELSDRASHLADTISSHLGEWATLDEHSADLVHEAATIHSKQQKQTGR